MKLITLLKWISATLIITGAVLTSMDIRPWNVWMFNISSITWMIVGFLWKEWSVIVMNGGLVAIYCYGLFFTFG